MAVRAKLKWNNILASVNGWFLLKISPLNSIPNEWKTSIKKLTHNLSIFLTVRYENERMIGELSAHVTITYARNNYLWSFVTSEQTCYLWDQLNEW